MTEISKLKQLSTVTRFSEQLWIDYMRDKSNAMGISELVIAGLYRNSVEFLDSIFVLSDHGLEGPASTCFRSYLEVMLALTYIISNPNYIDHRAKAYYVGSQIHAKNDIKSRLLKNKNNANSKNEEKELKAQLATVEKILKQPEIKDTIVEWKRTKKKSGKKYEPKWHSLYGGPNSIVQLSKYMQGEDVLLKAIMNSNPDLKKYYEITYAILSREAHSYTALEKYSIVNKDSNLVSMNPVRISAEEVLNGQYKLYNVVSMMTQINAIFVVNVYPDYKPKLVNFIKDYIKIETNQNIKARV